MSKPLHAPVIAVGRREQSAERVMRAAVIIPGEMGLEPALHLREEIVNVNSN